MKFTSKENQMKASFLLTLLIFIGMNFALQHKLQAQQHDTSQINIQTGSVNGKIEIPKMNTMEPSQHAARHPSYGTMNMTPQKTSATNEYANIVIYLEGQNLKREPQFAASHNHIDQQNAEFLPHVLPVLRGTVVDFINRDNVYHNVFSLSPPKKFNIGRRPTGQAVPVVMDKPGVVEIFCDIHANMAAFILVLDNDFFTQPNRKGNYSIDRIPSGTYTLKVWHERLSSQEQTITITPNNTTTVNFVME
jgi:plastocyanin